MNKKNRKNHVTTIATTTKWIFKEVIFFALAFSLVGCSESMEWDKKTESSLQNPVLQTDINSAVDKNGRTPLKNKWEKGDVEYDIDDTIYYKTFYDNFVQGYQMHFEYPNIDLHNNIEDYFARSESDLDNIMSISELFYDNRTIEIDEDTLKKLFYKYGYEVFFNSASIDDFHVRFIEIREIDNLSLYRSNILIQSWDDEYIYLQNITGPISRTIRSFIMITDRENPTLVVHSSGFSKDFVSEEELSFWTFRGSYWVLTPLDLTIDSSHAHSAGETLYPEIDRASLFEPVYYRDGVVYRTSMQEDGLFTHAYRLGKLEELEKNKRFRMISIVEFQGMTFEEKNCYLDYEIN